jgi:hypothetical protein
LKYLPAVVVVALLLSGCFSENQKINPIIGNFAQNQRPAVSGNPPSRVAVGQAYEFTPGASDADGDALKFSVSNKPSWANFDGSTGRLWGTPQAIDVGIHEDVKISVSDGRSVIRLPQFAINVDSIASGSVTLSWYPPTQNADGSALTDLAGYRIYYGTQVESLDQVITLENPGLTMLVIEELGPATWHFAMSSLNSRGVESERSPTVTKTVG